MHYNELDKQSFSDKLRDRLPWIAVATVALCILVVGVKGTYHWLLDPYHYAASFIVVVLIASTTKLSRGTKIAIVIAYCSVAMFAAPHVGRIKPPPASGAIGAGKPERWRRPQRAVA